MQEPCLLRKDFNVLLFCKHVMVLNAGLDNPLMLVTVCFAKSLFVVSVVQQIPHLYGALSSRATEVH